MFTVQAWCLLIEQCHWNVCTKWRAKFNNWRVGRIVLWPLMGDKIMMVYSTSFDSKIMSNFRTKKVWCYFEDGSHTLLLLFFAMPHTAPSRVMQNEVVSQRSWIWNYFFLLLYSKQILELHGCSLSGRTGSARSQPGRTHSFCLLRHLKY